MAKLERRFRGRAGRFFRRLLQGQARRAVSTRSPHRRSIRRKMACCVLPKTPRMFASLNLVTPSAVEKSLIFLPVIPSGLEESRCDSFKVTSAESLDFARDDSAVVTSPRRQQNRAPPFPPELKMPC